MQDKKSILEPDGVYHIYNRANGNERLFVDTENYQFFLDKYKQHVSPIVDTFCYCLMPNHFHFLLRIKGEEELKFFFEFDKDLTGFQNLSGLISKQFSNLLNSYAKAFNKQEGRKGSLFIRPFKRKKVTDEKYLRKLVHYIHYNPIEAGLVLKPEDWKYSSYLAIISDKATSISKNEVLNWFGDYKNFVHCHRYPPELTGV